MKSALRHYPTIASTLALVIALTMGGAWAASHLISGKQIKNNSIKAKKVKFPRARPLGPPAHAAAKAHASVSDQYSQVADLGSYSKSDPTSVLQVTWTGPVSTDFDPCVFQLRVDGQPPAGGGGGEVLVQNSTTLSISDQALFSGLGVGNHEVSVWARIRDVGPNYPCTVGGTNPSVPQTANAVELVN
jgi:hypothetical protein